MNQDHLHEILQYLLVHAYLPSYWLLSAKFLVTEEEFQSITQELFEEQIIERIERGSFSESKWKGYRAEWRLKAPCSEIEKLLLLC